MTLPNKSEILKLNTISGGRPTTLPVAPRGSSQTNLNSISGGRPIFVIGELGLNFNGFTKVGGVWKELTNGYIKVDGTWKELNELKVKVSGTWKS